MTKTAKATWDLALGDLACGRRNTQCVKAFDSLTNDMLSAKEITLGEFLGAQTVIGVAYVAAASLERVSTTKNTR